MTMGTWGHDNLENDAALDMLADVEAAGSLQPIYALAVSINNRHAADAETYFEVDDAQPIIGGGEIIAALAGYPSADVPPTLQALATNKTLKLELANVPPVIAAIEHVYRASELRELWEESDEFAAWEKNVSGLLTRLRKITAS